jgi:hypothetical protein
LNGKNVPELKETLKKLQTTLKLQSAFRKRKKTQTRAQLIKNIRSLGNTSNNLKSKTVPQLEKRLQNITKIKLVEEIKQLQQSIPGTGTEPTVFESLNITGLRNLLITTKQQVANHESPNKNFQRNPSLPPINRTSISINFNNLMRQIEDLIKMSESRNVSEFYERLQTVIRNSVEKYTPNQKSKIAIKEAELKKRIEEKKKPKNTSKNALTRAAAEVSRRMKLKEAETQAKAKMITNLTAAAAEQERRTAETRQRRLDAEAAEAAKAAEANREKSLQKATRTAEATQRERKIRAAMARQTQANAELMRQAAEAKAMEQANTERRAKRAQETRKTEAAAKEAREAEKNRVAALWAAAHGAKEASRALEGKKSQVEKFPNMENLQSFARLKFLQNKKKKGTLTKEETSELKKLSTLSQEGNPHRKRARGKSNEVTLIRKKTQALLHKAKTNAKERVEGRRNFNASQKLSAISAINSSTSMENLSTVMESLFPKKI